MSNLIDINYPILLNFEDTEKMVNPYKAQAKLVIIECERDMSKTFSNEGKMAEYAKALKIISLIKALAAAKRKTARFNKKIDKAMQKVAARI